MPRLCFSSSKPGLHSADGAGVVHTSPFRAKHPGTCFGFPRRGAMGEGVGLPRDGARTRLQAPNLGAVALSARSRTESRAPLGARERPRLPQFSSVQFTQSCLTLCDPMDTRLLHPWNFLGKSTGVGCHFLLQGIFPTRGSNQGLLISRQTLYQGIPNLLYDTSQF